MTRVFNSHMIHNHHYTSNAHAATESTELPTNTLITYSFSRMRLRERANERASEQARRRAKWNDKKNRTNYTLTSIVCMCVCVYRKPFTARQPDQNSKSNSNRAYIKKLLSSLSSPLPSFIPFQFLLLLFLLNDCCCCCCWFCRFVFFCVLYIIAYTIFIYIVYDFLVVPALLIRGCCYVRPTNLCIFFSPKISPPPISISVRSAFQPIRRLLKLWVEVHSCHRLIARFV